MCRFKFPKYPLDETRLILGLSKDLDESKVKERRKDLNKILKFLIRQTHSDTDQSGKTKLDRLMKMNFYEFLFASGMFSGDKAFEDFSEIEKQEAKTRYLNALSAGVQGSAMVVLKRDVKDIFINAYNKRIMQL